MFLLNLNPVNRDLSMEIRKIRNNIMLYSTFKDHLIYYMLFEMRVRRRKYFYDKTPFKYKTSLLWSNWISRIIHFYKKTQSKLKCIISRDILLFIKMIGVTNA